MTVCTFCKEPVLPGERQADLVNADAHWECGFRAIIGGLNHQMGRCTCCGGTEPPDPPNMTSRQAALAAVGYFYSRKAGEPGR